MSMLPKIIIQRTPTVREEVFKYLRHKILTGEAPPGRKLFEAKLAEEIGTSRTPVREALHNLEMQNLIESVPRVGYVVKEITQEDVEEMIEIRIPLESLAAKWASDKISSGDLRRLEKIILLTEAFISEENTTEVVDLDTEFHDIICRASGSRRIQEISQTLRDHMLRFRIRGLHVVEIARRSNDGHKRILRAMKIRNTHEIEAAVRYHLNWTRKDVTKGIKSGSVSVVQREVIS